MQPTTLVVPHHGGDHEREQHRTNRRLDEARVLGAVVAHHAHAEDPVPIRHAEGRDKHEVLQARLYLNRRFSVDLRPTVALMLDDWNRTRLFPKAYTVLPDDGMVGICAEQCHDFEAGVTREQLKYTVGVWIDTLLRFAEWVEEQV